MRILITGVGGFVGRHLAQHLSDTLPGVELHGAMIGPLPVPAVPDVACHVVDLRDPDAISALVTSIRPDRIFHLAAQAAVRQSFDSPWDTLENNIRAQLNLILACLKCETAPRMLIISSGEVYGTDQPPDVPTPENAPMRPSSPYSVSKVTQDMLGLQYFLSHNLPIMRARPFNHFGPGQNLGFVAPDFATQIARIEAGLQEPVMRVGSLRDERDFTDVRDIVRAYGLIMERGIPGEAYNVASGATHSIRKLLDTLLGFSQVQIEVRVETSLLRPRPVSKTWGDASRLRAVTGWEPLIPFEQTLLDVLNDWRARVKAHAQSGTG